MPSVETNGIETYYEARGDGDPVVFVHGATSDHQLWGPVVDRLEDSFRCIAYDVRGHGETGGSDRRVYSMQLFADDLAALAGALDLDAPAVVGLSMGGMIAQTCAVRHGDDLRAVVTAGAESSETADLKEYLVREMVPRLAAPSMKVVGYQRITSALSWIARRFVDDDGVADEDEIARIRDGQPDLTTPEVVKTFGALRSHHRQSLDYESVDVPMLALAGERELHQKDYHLNLLERRVPNAERDVVADAGHNAHVDDPEQFAARVADFLGGI